MQQQRALTGWPDAGDFLQTAFAQIAFAARPMRTDGESVRLVAQALDEIKHRIARRQLERIPSGDKERLPAGIAIRPFGDGDDRNFNAECSQNFARGGELALPAVDHQEIRPGGLVLSIQSHWVTSPCKG